MHLIPPTISSDAVACRAKAHCLGSDKLQQQQFIIAAIAAIAVIAAIATIATIATIAIIATIATIATINTITAATTPTTDTTDYVRSTAINVPSCQFRLLTAARLSLEKGCVQLLAEYSACRVRKLCISNVGMGSTTIRAAWLMITIRLNMTIEGSMCPSISSLRRYTPTHVTSLDWFSSVGLSSWRRSTSASNIDQFIGRTLRSKRMSVRCTILTTIS